MVLVFSASFSYLRFDIFSVAVRVLTTYLTRVSLRCQLKDHFVIAREKCIACKCSRCDILQRFLSIVFDSRLSNKSQTY